MWLVDWGRPLLQGYDHNWGNSILVDRTHDQPRALIVGQRGELSNQSHGVAAKAASAVARPAPVASVPQQNS